MSLAKQVISGTGVITVAGIGARLLAVLTVPILSPLLGPAPYGVAALVGTVTSLASVLALLGIDMAYARFFLQEDESQRAAVECFCWRFATTGGFVAALLAGCGWYWLGDRWVSDHRGIAIYSAIAIILSTVVTMTTTRVRLLGDYRRIGVSLCAASVVSAAVSIGLACFWRIDAWPLLLGILAASITSLFILGATSRLDLMNPSNLSMKTKLAVVSFGLAGSVTAPMYWVISSADRWFIARFSTTAEIGIYSMAASIAMLGLMLNNSLTLTWFPEASRIYGEQGTAALESLGRMWARLVVGLAVAWLAVAAAGGDALRLLAAPAFHTGAQYIPWLAGGVFFYGLAAMATTALFLEAKMRFAAILWTSGAVVCVALNFILVPQLGALGAAMAQCASYGVISLGLLVVSYRLLPLPVPVARLGTALSIVFGAGFLLIPAWAEKPIWSLTLKLPVGILFAWIVFRLIAPDWHQRLGAGLFRTFGSGKT